MKKTLLFIFISFAGFMHLRAQTIYLKAILSGSQEVPVNASTGRGTVIVTYNSSTKAMVLTGDYQNTTATVTDAHIHTGAPGVSGPVTIQLQQTASTVGMVSGTATLTGPQETDLLAGNMYVNVHTSAFPGGEIRGQLTTATAGQSVISTCNLRGNQSTPLNPSTGSGRVSVLLDNGTGTVYVAGSFTGLTSNITATHIHVGAFGANGAVIVPLNFVAGLTSGTIDGSGAISVANAAQLVAGNCYVNVHSVNYGAGEIRGQLSNPGNDNIRIFKGVLQASQEVPATASTGVGIVIAKYNRLTKQLDVVADYQNMSSAITGSHIHQAPPGVNGAIIVPLTATGGTIGTVTGSQVLTDVQETDLLAGQTYFNVHSAPNPGGELRAQLTVTSDGQTSYFTGILQGSQSVPANASAGSGNATAVLDKPTRTVWATSNFTGLTANVSTAHIHTAPAGVNGAVVVPFNWAGTTSGNASGTGIISSSDSALMVGGSSYVNIHSTSFPGGEIRAQLGSVILPIKLGFFNGSRQQDNIVLTWRTSQETNFSRFEVEQLDSRTSRWIAKGNVTGTGGNSAADYRFTDIPFRNDNYAVYRLKMVDKDGAFSYSPVVTITMKSFRPELVVFNNPVSGNSLSFQVTGLQADVKMQFKVIDSKGAVVMEKSVSALSRQEISVAGLAAGTYKLLVNTDEKIMQKTFVKQ